MRKFDVGSEQGSSEGNHEEAMEKRNDDGDGNETDEETSKGLK